MEQVDYSTINRLRFNGTDINNLFVNGVLIWLKHTSGAFYKGQTLYLKYGPVKVTKLETDLDLTGIDAAGNEVYFNIMVDQSDIALTPAQNTSGYFYGQIIFVGGSEGRITGIDDKTIYYTLLDGTKGSTDTSGTHNVTTVGTGGGGSTNQGGSINTDLYQVGENIYVNGRLATIRGIGTGTLFIEYNDDGTFATISDGGIVSTQSNSTGYQVGDTIYVNGREAVVTGVAGDIVTFQYVDDSTYGSLGTGANNGGGQLSGTPNTTGYEVGDIIYINGRQAIVTGVSGGTITYRFLDGNNESGTATTGTDDDDTISDEPNTSGYNVGDVFYLNGIRCVVTGVSGGNITYVDDLGGTGTIDPSTTTGITETAPNETGFNPGMKVFVAGVPKTIYSIAGKVITFTDGSSVNVDTTNVLADLHWNYALRNYNNSTSTWSDPE